MTSLELVRAASALGMAGFRYIQHVFRADCPGERSRLGVRQIVPAAAAASPEAL